MKLERGRGKDETESNTVTISRIVIMGVTASGKSTLGKALAKKLSIPFIDGDRLHPKSNIEKMESGIPLEDDDRWLWLEKIGKALAEADTLIVACSALKQSYRKCINDAAGKPVIYLHLIGDKELLLQRMGKRTQHFMPLTLLESQLAALEPPGYNEQAIEISVDDTLENIVRRAVVSLEASDQNQ
jgi:gluconokinase